MPDPCTLITTAEASVALLEPAGDFKLFQSIEKECYIKPAGAGLGYISIKIVERGRTYYDFLRKAKLDIYNEELKDLSDLGDAAFTIGNEITVLKGSYVIVYFLSPDNSSSQPERTLAVARAGTARL